MNETIFILGLGETLKFFKDYEGVTLGVNDIWRSFKTDLVLTVDTPSRFEKSRLETIKTSKPLYFYSQIRDWKNHLSSFQHISISPISDFQDGKVYFSNNSTFVACSLAYTLGFKRIVIYGADFNTHKKLKGHDVISKILKDFSWLKQNFNKRGVSLEIGHKASKLSEVLPVYSPVKI